MKEQWEESSLEDLQLKASLALINSSYRKLEEDWKVEHYTIWRFYQRHVAKGKPITQHSIILDCLGYRLRFEDGEYMLEKRCN